MPHHRRRRRNRNNRNQQQRNDNNNPNDGEFHNPFERQYPHGHDHNAWYPTNTNPHNDNQQHQRQHRGWHHQQHRRNHRTSPYPSPPPSSSSTGASMSNGPLNTSSVHWSSNTNNGNSRRHNNTRPIRLGFHAVTSGPANTLTGPGSWMVGTSNTSNPEATPVVSAINGPKSPSVATATATAEANTYRQAHTHLLRRSLRFRAYLVKLLELSRVQVEQWLPETSVADVVLGGGDEFGSHDGDGEDEDEWYSFGDDDGMGWGSGYGYGYESSSASLSGGGGGGDVVGYDEPQRQQNGYGYGHGSTNDNNGGGGGGGGYWEGYIDGHEAGVVEGDDVAEEERRFARRVGMEWRSERTVEIPVTVGSVVYPWDGERGIDGSGDSATKSEKRVAEGVGAENCTGTGDEGFASLLFGLERQQGGDKGKGKEVATEDGGSGAGAEEERSVPLGSGGGTKRKSI